MNEFSTYEYTVKQKNEGKWIARRVGLIFLYAAFVFAWVVMGLTTRILVPLLALIPVTTGMLIFATWRYVSVEYEYSITSGVFTFTKVFGGRSRKKILEVALKDAILIAPLDDERARTAAERYHPGREFHAISSLSSPDVYFILFEYENKKEKEKRRGILYFEATEKALSICRFYNKSATTVRETRY